MKKILVLALLPMWIACTKSSDVKIEAEKLNESVSLAQQGGSSLAKQGYNTTFTSFQTHGAGETYQGTFAVSGLITGTGTTNESVGITMPSGSAQAFANATYTFHSTQTFTFDDNSGTITIKTAGQWAFTDATLTNASGTGNWNIIKGTGAYAKLKGNGTLEISDIDFVNGTVTDTYYGNLHF